MNADNFSTSGAHDSLPRYGIFGALLALVGLPVYIHAPKYYVDTHGLGLASLGVALLLVRTQDFVQDPILGRLIDRHRNRAPMIVAIAMTALVCAVMGLFMPSPPLDPVVWFLISLGVVYLAFSALNILYYAHGVVLGERLGTGGHVSVAGWREGGIMVGICLACAAPTAFATLFPDHNPFVLFTIGFAVCAAGGVVMMHRRWIHSSGNVISFNQPGMVGVLRRDKTLRKLFILGFINALPVAVTSTLFLFFVEYRLGLQSEAGVMLIVFFAAAAVSAPLWSWLARQNGIRHTLIISMVLAIVSFVWAWSLGEGDARLFYAVCLISGAGLGGDMVLLPALFSKRIAESQVQGGAAFGFWNFASNLALALAAAIVLPTLDWAGFQPQGNVTEQGLMALGITYALVPCTLKLAALGFVLSLSLEETDR